MLSPRKNLSKQPPPKVVALRRWPLEEAIIFISLFLSFLVLFLIPEFPHNYTLVGASTPSVA
jgi:hypothetical protein